ncbi:MAG TPA: protoheme IX farnesyltransferase, partial [Actinomycetota bacterium]|nr:protoheme IX farnesyltransferase [Actinomycetota bacterium]
SVARMGAIYLVSALILNAVFVYGAIRLYRNTVPTVAWWLFRFSIYYLALLFGAMAADRLILA